MEESSPTDSVIRPNSGHIFITPFGFHLYATDFLTSAKNFPPSDRFSPVPYYCYCRAIELCLKAFLLGKGISKDDLKNRKQFGHDLVKLVDHAMKLGVTELVDLSKARLECVGKANDYYAAKGFEYFDLHNAVRGYSGLPTLALLDELASELVSRLEQYCMDVTDNPPSTSVNRPSRPA